VQLRSEVGVVWAVVRAVVTCWRQHSEVGVLGLLMTTEVDLTLEKLKLFCFTFGNENCLNRFANLTQVAGAVIVQLVDYLSKFLHTGDICRSLDILHQYTVVFRNIDWIADAILLGESYLT
jgi:hypothetical protein